MRTPSPASTGARTTDPIRQTLLALAVDPRLPGMVLDPRTTDPERLLGEFASWFPENRRPLPVPTHLTPADLRREEWSFGDEPEPRHPSFLQRARGRTLVVRRPDELDADLWCALSRESVSGSIQSNDTPLQIVVVESKGCATPRGPFLRPRDTRPSDPVERLRNALAPTNSTVDEQTLEQIGAAQEQLGKIEIEPSVWPALRRVDSLLAPEALGSGDQRLTRAVRLLLAWAALERRSTLTGEDAHQLLAIFPHRETAGTEEEPSSTEPEELMEVPSDATPSGTEELTTEPKPSRPEPLDSEPLPTHITLPSGTALPRVGRGTRGPGSRHGRVVGHRPAGTGRRGPIDAAATLRRALPFQPLRGRAPGDPPILVEDDLRMAIRRRRHGELYVLVLDASGSMRGDRIRLARGAALAILEEAYRTRASLGLVVVSGGTARLAVPPMKSPGRLQRTVLSERTTGGTALALGLRIALEQGRSRQTAPRILLATDGRANLALDGSRDPDRATREVRQLLEAARATGTTPVVLGRQQDRRARGFATGHQLPFVPVHPLDPARAAARIESMKRIHP